jgi:hypothetical protein
VHFFEALNLDFYPMKKIKFGVFLHNINFMCQIKNIGIVVRFVMSKHTLSKLNHSIWPCNEGWACISVKLAKIALLH